MTVFKFPFLPSCFQRVSGVEWGQIWKWHYIVVWIGSGCFRWGWAGRWGWSRKSSKVWVRSKWIHSFSIAGFRDLFGDADFAEERCRRDLGCIELKISDEHRALEPSCRLPGKILVCTGPDSLGYVKIKVIIMEVGVGPARYRDLNSDLPVCISTGSSSTRHLHIQTVTGLVSRCHLWNLTLCHHMTFWGTLTLVFTKSLTPTCSDVLRNTPETYY